MKIVKIDNYNPVKSYSIWEEIYDFCNYKSLYNMWEDIKCINEFLDNDIRKVTKEDYFNFQLRFYNIYITDDDIFKILSKINKVNYTEFQTIKTMHYFKQLINEGHGRDFSYWEDTFLLEYFVAVKEGFKLDDKVYSNEEILKMIENNEIVILDTRYNNLGMSPKIPFESEKIISLDNRRINILSSLDDIYNTINLFDIVKNDEISQYDQRFIDEALRFVKSRISYIRILKDLAKDINWIKEKLIIDDERIYRDCYNNSYYDIALNINENVGKIEKKLFKK